MTTLELAYGLYKPQQKPIRKLKPRKKPAYVPALGKPAEPSKTPVHFKPTALTKIRENSKSVEPPKLPHLRSASPDPLSLYPKGMKTEVSVSTSMDNDLERLEHLAFKNVSARSELLAIQQRLMDIHMKSQLQEIGLATDGGKAEKGNKRWKLPPLEKCAN
jgi:hypothetical protein